jgi:hypothetical protein
MTKRNRILVAIGIAALALPAYAAAKPGNGHGKPHNAMYILKGTYGDGAIVSVDHGNAHAKRAGLVGTDVALDISAAKITVADTNADGTADASDVLAGDRVLVQARLPKGDPGTAPFAARHLVDQTNSADAADDDEGDDEGDDADDGDDGEEAPAVD